VEKHQEGPHYFDRILLITAKYPKKLPSDCAVRASYDDSVGYLDVTGELRPTKYEYYSEYEFEQEFK